MNVWRLGWLEQRWSSPSSQNVHTSSICEQTGNAGAGASAGAVDAGAGAGAGAGGATAAGAPSSKLLSLLQLLRLLVVEMAVYSPKRQATVGKRWITCNVSIKPPRIYEMSRKIS